MPDELTQTPESSATTEAPVEAAETKELKFTIEKIDEKTARKIDKTETVTIINIDILRKLREELQGELAMKQASFDEINAIIVEFEKK
jgi:uncharacterized protein (DUF169 family)